MHAALGFVARWATFVAILAAGGACAFRWLVARRVANKSEAFARAAERAAWRGAAVGASAAAVVLPCALVQLAVQTAAMKFPDDPWLGVAGSLITSTQWGTVWLAQIAAAICSLAAFVLARRRGNNGPWVAAIVCVAALAITPSLSSHAMSAEGRRWISVPADLVHVVGASLWLGTLGVMFATANDEWRGDASGGAYVRAMLGAFSPLALIGAAALVGSGIVSSLVHLAHPLAVLQSRWGQLLAAKLVVVLIVLYFGWRNWKRHTPAVDIVGSNPIWRGMRAEVLATLAVLLLTAALVVTSPPMDAMPMP